MNRTERSPAPPPAEVKPNQKTALKDLASKSCSRCGGRGYTAYNRTTNRYIPCPCVKKRLARSGMSTIDVAGVRGMEAEKAACRAREGYTHLERLGGEIHRIRETLEPIITEQGAVSELSDEEIDLNLEFDFRAEELNRKSQVATAYRARANQLEIEARGFAELSVSLKAEARKLSAQASECSTQFLERHADVQDAVIALDREVKIRTGETRGTRQRLQHKLRKKLREHEKRLDKLMSRAGRVKLDIERDMAIYGSESITMSLPQGKRNGGG